MLVVLAARLCECTQCRCIVPLKFYTEKWSSVVFQAQTQTGLNQQEVIPEGLNANMALQELGGKWEECWGVSWNRKTR